MKFFIPSQTLLASKRNYQLLAKSHPKFIRTLKLDSCNYDEISIGQEARKCLITLSKIKRKTKHIVNFNASKFLSLAEIPNTKLKETIKRFHKIQGLSPPYHYRYEKTLLFYIKWLRLCPNLRSFQIISSFISKGNLFSKKFIKIKQRFLKFLSTSRLATFSCFEMNESLIVPFQSYPKSLQKIYVGFIRQDIPYLQQDWEQFPRKPFSHIKNLQFLEISRPVPPRLLQGLLSTISQPKNMTHLALSISSSDQEGHLAKLQETLSLFTSLQSLNIGSSFSPFPFQALQPFQETPLTSIQLKAVIQDSSELEIIGTFLHKLGQLKILKLHLEDQANKPVPLGYQSLFQNISRLIHLETIEFNIDSESIADSQVLLEGSLQAFAQSLEQLPRIKNVSLRHIKGIYPPEFGALASALEKVGKGLRTLKISLADNKLRLEDLLIFKQALQNTTNLETLYLENFAISDDEFVKKFPESINHLKSLKDVKILHLVNNITQNSYLLLIKGILSIRGLESLNCRDTTIFSEYGYQYGAIDLNEILQENPKLKTFIRPHYLKSFFENTDSMWKW